MEKIVRLGIDYHNNNVFCKIKLIDGKLSITGVEGPKSNGDCKGSCGQIILSGPLSIKEYAPGWDKRQVKLFSDVWKEWHLNDMRSECEHQRQRDETWANHPSAVCPDCGYKLGSAWLKEELPEYVEVFLSGLPDTD